MSVSERKFGVLQTGETVKIFHLENKSGAYAEVTDFGACLLYTSGIRRRESFYFV